MLEPKNRIGYKWIEVDHTLYEMWQALMTHSMYRDWRHEIMEDGSIVSRKQK